MLRAAHPTLPVVAVFMMPMPEEACNDGRGDTPSSARHILTKLSRSNDFSVIFLGVFCSSGEAAGSVRFVRCVPDTLFPLSGVPATKEAMSFGEMIAKTVEISV